MSDSRLSIEADSLNGSRDDEARLVELKQKQDIIEDQAKIIASLRDRLNDFEQENWELEKNVEILTQTSDRKNKEILDKDEQLDSLAHAMKQVEQAHDNLNAKYQSRLEQLKAAVEDVMKANKELSESKLNLEKLIHENEKLKTELQLANSRARSGRQHADPEHVVQLQSELKSVEESWQAERNQKESYHRQVAQLKKHIEAQAAKYADLESQYVKLKERELVVAPPSPFKQHCPAPRAPRAIPLDQHENSPVQCRRHQQYQRDHYHYPQYPQEHQYPQEQQKQYPQEQQQYPKHQHQHQAPQQQQQRRASHEENPNLKASIQFSMADEVGEFMNTSVIHSALDSTRLAAQSNAQKHRQASQLWPGAQRAAAEDPMQEQRQRLERARELARRNKLSKPLHQTSYPLELETFDASDLTEVDIRRGLREPCRPSVRPPLANASNRRAPVKKAEAFVV